jgi:hypothetical protein
MKESSAQLSPEVNESDWEKPPPSIKALVESQGYFILGTSGEKPFKRYRIFDEEPDAAMTRPFA